MQPAQVDPHQPLAALGLILSGPAELKNRLEAALGVRLPIADLLQGPPLAVLADRVLDQLQGAPVPVEQLRRQGSNVADAPILPRAAGQEDHPLALAQEPLWFLDQFEPGNPAYHIGAVLRMRDRIKAAALENALQEVVRRQDALRTTFVIVDGSTMQRVAPEVIVPFPVVDLRTLPHAARERPGARVSPRGGTPSFDLTRGPLIRAVLLRLGEEEYWLLLTVHHIVADGWSMRVLLHDVVTLYGAFAREGAIAAA